VRLVNGTSQLGGRLEVRIGDFWGAVCSDGFDENAARVVCRMLGKGGGTPHGNARYGEGTGQGVFVDATECVGTEAALGECKLDLSPFCMHAKDVGVQCLPRK